MRHYLLIILLLASCDNHQRACDDRTEALQRHVPTESFDGIILEKIFDPEFRMQPVVVLGDTYTKTVSDKAVIRNDEKYKLMKPGDRILKVKGRMDYLLLPRENNDTIIFFSQTCEKDIK